MARKKKANVFDNAVEILKAGFMPIFKKKWGTDNIEYFVGVALSPNGKSMFVQDNNYDSIEAALENLDSDDLTTMSTANDYELISAILPEWREDYTEKEFSEGDLVFIVKSDEVNSNIGTGLRKCEGGKDSGDDYAITTPDESDYEYVNALYVCPGFEGMIGGDTIEIDGKKYDKAALLERIKELDPIS